MERTGWLGLETETESAELLQALGISMGNRVDRIPPGMMV